MVREFVDRVFNGSAEPLLAHLIEDERLTKADLEELARMIRKERVMSGLFLGNLFAYAMQTTILLGSGAIAFKLLRLNHPQPAIVGLANSAGRLPGFAGAAAEDIRWTAASLLKCRRECALPRTRRRPAAFSGPTSRAR